MSGPLILALDEGSSSCRSVLVDAAADTTHPEWTGDPNFRTIPGTPVTNLPGWLAVLNRLDPITSSRTC